MKRMKTFWNYSNIISTKILNCYFYLNKSIFIFSVQFGNFVRYNQAKDFTFFCIYIFHCQYHFRPFSISGGLLKFESRNLETLTGWRFVTCVMKCNAYLYWNIPLWKNRFSLELRCQCCMQGDLVSCGSDPSQDFERVKKYTYLYLSLSY